jgi:hypothetical protein
VAEVPCIQDNFDPAIRLGDLPKQLLCSIRGIVVDQDYLEMIHGDPRKTFRYSPDKLLHIPLFVSTPGNNA